MTTATVTNSDTDKHCAPRFCVNIEGTLHDWPVDTITREQIAFLGCWDVEQGVLEIDKDNNERTLEPGEVVKLDTGKAFCKKTRWKRG